MHQSPAASKSQRYKGRLVIFTYEYSDINFYIIVVNITDIYISSYTVYIANPREYEEGISTLPYQRYENFG